MFVLIHTLLCSQICNVIHDAYFAFSFHTHIHRVDVHSFFSIWVIKYCLGIILLCFLFHSSSSFLYYLPHITLCYFHLLSYKHFQESLQNFFPLIWYFINLVHYDYIFSWSYSCPLVPYINLYTSNSFSQYFWNTLDYFTLISFSFMTIVSFMFCVLE